MHFHRLAVAGSDYQSAFAPESELHVRGQVH